MLMHWGSYGGNIYAAAIGDPVKDESKDLGSLQKKKCLASGSIAARENVKSFRS